MLQRGQSAAFLHEALTGPFEIASVLLLRATTVVPSGSRMAKSIGEHFLDCDLATEIGSRGQYSSDSSI